MAHTIVKKQKNENIFVATIKIKVLKIKIKQPAAESAVAPQKQVSPTLARVLSSGSGTLGTQ